MGHQAHERGGVWGTHAPCAQGGSPRGNHGFPRARNGRFPTLSGRRELVGEMRFLPRTRADGERSACEHLGEVLVASPGEPYEHELGVDIECAGEGMRGLERRDDALRLREVTE